jgi:hypothetical protein
MDGTIVLLVRTFFELQQLNDKNQPGIRRDNVFDAHRAVTQ